MRRLLPLLLVLIFVGTSFAITLTWDENDPAPDGYRLFQRTNPGSYDYGAPVWEDALPPSDEITGLALNQEYCWVVRAYVGPDESGDSNEVCHTVGSTNLTQNTTGFGVSWVEIVDPPPPPAPARGKFSSTYIPGTGWMIMIDGVPQGARVRIGY